MKKRIRNLNNEVFRRIESLVFFTGTMLSGFFMLYALCTQRPVFFIGTGIFLGLMCFLIWLLNQVYFN
jgi:hypothetical protein